MEDAKTVTRSKLGWAEFVAIFLSVYLGDIPARIWHLPTIVSKCLVLPVVLLPLYWLSPNFKPKNKSLTQYIGFLLVVACLLLIVLWGVPELLSLFIPRGWAYGLPIFVTLQSAYWIIRYRIGMLGEHLPSPMISSIAWLLISLLLALALGVPKQLYNF
ncbi:MAG: hypothetical protein HYR56_23400 [Acidobacteria bacterium]|nr:hypothetical protein [Acidobacteriota bacterium]MBI3422827.1 hypothetical protein [Acidobacteriota bacterium]